MYILAAFIGLKVRERAWEGAYPVRKGARRCASLRFYRPSLRLVALCDLRESAWGGIAPDPAAMRIGQSLVVSLFRPVAVAKTP